MPIRKEPTTAEMQELMQRLRPLVHVDGQCSDCHHSDAETIAIGNTVLKWWSEFNIDDWLEDEEQPDTEKNMIELRPNSVRAIVDWQSLSDIQRRTVVTFLEEKLDFEDTPNDQNPFKLACNLLCNLTKIELLKD